MTIKDKILIIEDDISISGFIRTILNANGYEVLRAENGKEGLSMASSHCPDLVVLDLGLPDLDGLDIIRQIRSWSQMPIVVVSARTHEHDKVEALELGADDYISKPFGSAELVARVRVALRHTRATVRTGLSADGKLTIDGLTVDYDKHWVLINGENAHLTQNEYKIVALLSKYAGKVLTYDFIMKELWGPQTDSNNQILRVNVANIRRKIEENPAEPKYIFTEVGVGYRMRESEE